MKETKVYVDELPKSCEKCPLGYFYDCQYCFLRPDLAEKHEWCEKDKHCPLIDIKTHDRELVNEVCEKIRIKVDNISMHTATKERLMIMCEEIQKEFKDE